MKHKLYLFVCSITYSIKWMNLYSPINLLIRLFYLCQFTLASGIVASCLSSCISEELKRTVGFKDIADRFHKISKREQQHTLSNAFPQSACTNHPCLLAILRLYTFFERAAFGIRYLCVAVRDVYEEVHKSAKQ